MSCVDILNLVRGCCCCCCSAVVDHETIDEINILQAAMLAMQMAVEGLARCPDAVLIDGNRCAGVSNMNSSWVIEGDIAQLYHSKAALD